MAQPKPFLRILGAIAFSLAFLLGISLIIIRSVPDLEASMYGFLKFGYHATRSFSCPVLMTKLDREPMILRLHNPLDRSLTWYVNAQLSSPAQFIESQQTVEVPSRQTQTLTWEVDKKNVDLGNFIFAHVYTSPAAALGMTENTCGTLVLNLPFQGGPAIYYAILFFTLVCGTAGLWLLGRHSDMSDPSVVSQTSWMRFTALVIIIGILTSLLDYWFLGIVTLLLTLLLFSLFLIPRKL